MQDLIARIDRMSAERQLPWTRRGMRVRVTFNTGGRSQEIRLGQEADEYVFTSIVQRRKDMGNSRKALLQIAYQSWRKNALKQLVTFSFDADSNLIGAIRHPAATLDDNELLLTIEVLAKEVDRFEYKLTGKDRE